MTKYAKVTFKNGSQEFYNQIYRDENFVEDVEIVEGFIVLFGVHLVSANEVLSVSVNEELEEEEDTTVNNVVVSYSPEEIAKELERLLKERGYIRQPANGGYVNPYSYVHPYYPWRPGITWTSGGNSVKADGTTYAINLDSKPPVTKPDDSDDDNGVKA